MKFNELDLSNQVLEGIKAAGFEQCMPVQEEVLPVSLKGKDVLVQAKTGSGKTAVFVITFLEEFLRKKEAGKTSSCMIIAPTRELAQQIASDSATLCSGIPGFRIGCFVGGTGYEQQKKMLSSGCDLYIGTPGRIIDFLRSGDLVTRGIDTFVIDEADRLFDMGFYPDIVRIFKKLVGREKRQTMLFSATLNMRVRELAWEFMNNPETIELEPETKTVDGITQQLYHVAMAEKFHLLLQVLAAEKPGSVLIFTNSRNMTSVLTSKLRYNGMNAAGISGELSQAARETALADFKKGKTKILVATDVAARGLQIDNLPLVINYDLPEDYENYVHRIGRTARAGATGKAISLVDEKFVYGLEAIEKYINMKIPVMWPDSLPEVEEKTGSVSAGVGKKTGRTAGEQQKQNKQRTEKTQRTQNVQQRQETYSRTEHSSADRPGKTEIRRDRVQKHGSLGKMTEEERLEYYRQRYGFIPKTENKSASGKASVGNSTTAETELKAIAEAKAKAETKPKGRGNGIKYLIWAFPAAGVFILLTVLLFFIPGMILRLLGLRKAGDCIVFAGCSAVSRFTLKLLNVHVTVTGERDIVEQCKGKKICYIANHTSMLDILLIEGPLNLKCGFIAKSVLRFVPLLDIALSAMNCVLISRENLKQSAKAIKKGADKIRKGYSMLIFPEGTRSKTGQIAPFRRGAFKLAVLSGAVAVPITIKGVRKALEDRKRPFCRTECMVNIGKPVAFDSSDRKAVAQACADVERSIGNVYYTH